MSIRDAEVELQKYTMSGECDGYWHGQPGMVEIDVARTGINKQRDYA
jgi:hypothetical protein